MQAIKKVGRKLGIFMRLVMPVVPLFILALLLLITIQRLPKTTTSISKDLIDAWKDVITVVSTGIIALSGAYVGGMLQAQQEREREFREIRKERTRPYREYLIELLSIGQRIETVAYLQIIEKSIAEELFPPEERKTLAKNLPPIGELSAIDDDKVRMKVDEAIKIGLRYIGQSSKGRPSKDEVRRSYRDAIGMLDLYDDTI